MTLTAAAPGATAAAPRQVPAGLLTHLRRARDHMDRNFDADLDLARVAAVAGISKYHFVRAFDAAYSETPMRYLSRRRIERAQDLLRHANLTVTEICIAVGFTSLGSFSARFTELVGMTPTAYRDHWAARDGDAHVPGCWLFMRGVLDLRCTSDGEASAQSRRSPGDEPASTVEP